MLIPLETAKDVPADALEGFRNQPYPGVLGSAKIDTCSSGFLSRIVVVGSPEGESLLKAVVGFYFEIWGHYALLNFVAA
jgi:hypothetical protein